MATVDSTERALRAYAYLTASFRTEGKVADVFDCLTPFLSAAILEEPDKPVDIRSVVERVKQYGLDVPFYVVEQLLPRLQRNGIVEWNTLARAFIPCAQIQQSSQFPALPDSFDALEPALAEYASARGILQSPLSATWSEAIINFLKESYSGRPIKAIKTHGVIVADTPEIESFIVASFLRDIARSRPDLYDHVVRVYTGVLIEDFISNVQSLNQSSDYSRLSIYYDTSIILRILGTSGTVLHEATAQMHHTLQALGAKTYYLGHTSTEVENILATLAAAYERGQEIYNETADALLDGEITIGQIRDLSGTFESRLATLNIFAFSYDHAGRKTDDYYQIDEIAFSEALKSAALRKERVYSVQNALNDAGAVAIILRIRRGRSARDIGKSIAIFVSRNALLQRVSRRFAIEKTEHFDDGSIPPVLTTGQITTASWLAEGHDLEASKISKELLAACYSAVQPSADWADEFASALDEFRQQNPDVISGRADSLLFLQAARHAARDASFNDPTVLRRINTAEMFRKAAEEARLANEHREASAAADKAAQEEREVALAVRFEIDKTNLVQRLASDHDLKLKEQTAAANAEGRREAEQEAELRRDVKSQRIAGMIVNFIRIVLVLPAAYVLLFADTIGKSHSMSRLTALVIALVITVLAVLDLMGLPVVRPFFDAVRLRFSKFLRKLM